MLIAEGHMLPVEKVIWLRKYSLCSRANCSTNVTFLLFASMPPSTLRVPESVRHLRCQSDNRVIGIDYGTFFDNALLVLRSGLKLLKGNDVTLPTMPVRGAISARFGDASVAKERRRAPQGR